VSPSIRLQHCDIRILFTPVARPFGLAEARAVDAQASLHVAETAQVPGGVRIAGLCAVVSLESRIAVTDPVMTHTVAGAVVHAGTRWQGFLARIPREAAEAHTPRGMALPLAEAHVWTDRGVGHTGARGADEARVAHTLPVAEHLIAAAVARAVGGAAPNGPHYRAICAYKALVAFACGPDANTMSRAVTWAWMATH